MRASASTYFRYSANRKRAVSTLDQPASVKREDGSWLVDGMVPFDEVAHLIGMPRLADEEHVDYTTLGGFVMAQLKRIPAAADSITIDGFKFEVMDMDGRRVDKVLVVPPTPADAGVNI